MRQHNERKYQELIGTKGDGWWQRPAVGGAIDTGDTVAHILKQMGRQRNPDHIRPMEWFLRYCRVPPVVPFMTNQDAYKPKRTEPRPKECIACGKVHITSEDCGREGPDRDWHVTQGRRLHTRLVDAEIMRMEME